VNIIIVIDNIICGQPKKNQNEVCHLEH